MLNSKDIAIFLVAKELGVDFKKYEEDNLQRIFFQKVFYLIGLTEEGSFLKMDYSLNSRGPYSPDLAEIGHLIAQKFLTLENETSLNSEGKELIQKLSAKLPGTIQRICNKPAIITKDKNIEKTEAIATMIMFYKNYFLVEDENKKRSRVLMDLISLKNEMKELDLNELYKESINFVDKHCNAN